MSDSKQPILFAYAFDGSGGGQVVKGKEISRKVKSDTLTWVHMDAAHPETRVWLQKEVSYLDPLVIEALLAEETRPRFMPYGDGAVIILRAVNVNENSRPEDMISIRMWVDGKRIISLRLRALQAVDDMQERIRTGRGPRNSGDFLTMLATKLFERMEPVFAELDRTTDEIEEDVLSEPDTRLRGEIISVRKQAIVFRRYIAPQRDVMGQLRISELEWLDANHRRQLQENYDRVTRYLEDLDAIHERSEIVQDELSNALTDKLNKNMYILSVLSAVFLPLGFLTGLFSMNVGGIPGNKIDSAFWIVSIVTVVIGLLQVYVFRKLKLF